MVGSSRVYQGKREREREVTDAAVIWNRQTHSCLINTGCKPSKMGETVLPKRFSMNRNFNLAASN